MLTEKEADELSRYLEELSCTNPKAGDGLFTFAMLSEPAEQQLAYERHMVECEYCRTALELYRYKRDAAKLYGKWARAKEIVARAGAGNSTILKRDLENGTTAYFQPGQDQRGTIVVVDSLGAFLSVEERSSDDFHRLRAE